MKVEIVATDAGRIPGEVLDCTVRATAVALGIPYVDAHTRLKRLGRKDRHCAVFSQMAKRLPLEQRPDLSCMTVERALPQMRRGRFIVRVPRHVFAVVDGAVYDLPQDAPKRTARVQMVYEVTP